jgi:hypothetical protein
MLNPLSRTLQPMRMPARQVRADPMNSSIQGDSLLIS